MFLTRRLIELRVKNQGHAFYRHHGLYDPFKISLILLLALLMHPNTAFAQVSKQKIQFLSPTEIQKGKDLLKKKGIKEDSISDLTKNKSSISSKTASPQKKTLPSFDTPSEKKDLSFKGGKSTRSVRKTASTHKKTKSYFEKYISGELPESISLDIEQFGYDLFRNPPSTFSPVDVLPVGPDYLLGPGDELRVALWGKVNADDTVILDRDGKVLLPQVGTLHLAGLTFSEAKDFLKMEFARYFNPSEVKINVSMGQLRSIRIFVVGKALSPGSYTLSSFSTLVNALFAAGGPSKIGSIRNIVLKRNGKTLRHFDLYDLLLKGDKGGDIRLMPEDVIFIPTVGPLIGIAGNVKAPAIYESRGEMPLEALIEMAGGITATGYLQRIQVERIFENASKTILDIDLDTLSEEKKLPLKDGDLVKIFSINNVITNSVALRGNVNRPGIYAWKKRMQMRDLIKSLNDLLPDTYLKFALVERRVSSDQHKEYLSINLEKLLLENDDKENIALRPNDVVLVYNRWDLLEKQRVQLEGAVNKPGEYEFRPNMKLSDLFNLAGGLKRPDHPNSYLPKGIITRRMPPDFHEEKIAFDFIGTIVNKNERSDLGLKPFDQVRIFDIWELAQENTVKIAGAVLRPGEYPWAQKMRISHLLNLSGGAKHFAFLESAELTRIRPTPEGPQIDRIDINLQEAINGNTEYDLVLQKDDHLSVQTVPEWGLYRTVQIEGEVRFPGSYTTKKGETLSSLLERAGGYTENAYLKGAIFIRKSVRVLQQRQLDDAIDRLEHQILSESAATIEAALTPETAQQQAASTEHRKALIAKMRSAKAKGRMTIHLDNLETFTSSTSNIVLEDKDHLIVPERHQQIQVIGAVYNQTAFIYDPDTTVSHYLDYAGGFTENANEDRLYVLKVNGTAVSKQQSNGFWKRGLLSQQLDPGDTIVVPEEINQVAWLREVKDMTQILYQIAVTAGVFIVAF